MPSKNKILRPYYEKCLVLIKPEHFERGGEILDYLESLLIKTNLAENSFSVTIGEVPLFVAEAHCIEHRRKPFYEALVAQFAWKPVVAVTYLGTMGLIREIRKIVGDKDPVVARMQKYRGKQTVRGKFADPEETLQRSINLRYGTRNVVHCSDSVQGAVYELSLEVWGKYFADSGSFNSPENREGMDLVWRLMEEGEWIADDCYRISTEKNSR